MHRDAHRSQVVYSQDTANHISTEVVENENFPYRLAIRGKNRTGRGEPIRMGVIFVCLVDGLVQVENLLERGWGKLVVQARGGKMNNWEIRPI